MLYYKDDDRKPYAYEDDTDPKYIKEGLAEIDKEEFDLIVEEINTPTPEEQTARNKAKAVALLAETDFVEIPSVTDTSTGPYLVNADAFGTYRCALRVIAVHPTPDAVFPDKPEEIWS